MVKLLPGFQRLQNFVEEFKRDFDCLQPDRIRRQQYSITFDAPEDNQGSSTRTTTVESSLTTTPTSTSNPVNVDSPGPQPIIEVQEGPASATAADVLVEVHAQESPSSVTSASSNPSTSHVSLIPQAGDDAVNSCIATAGEATLAVPCLSPPETEDSTVSDTTETEDGTVSDTSGTEEDSKSEETANAEDTVTDECDDDRPQHMTLQFHNCQTVCVGSFNARGVKVENAGNNAPQAIYNSPPSSSGSSASSCRGVLCQCSRYEVVLSDLTRYELPPMLPPFSFQESKDKLSSPPGIPPVGIPGPNSDPCSNQFTVESPVDLPFLKFEARQASMSPRNSKLPVTMDTIMLMQVNDDDDDDDANSGHQSPNMPGSKFLPGSKFPPFPTNTSGHPIHTGLFLPQFPASNAVQNALNTADILSSRLNSQSPHFPVESLPATNSSRDSLDPSILLEHQLECVLETIQKKLQTNSAEILSPRAQGILIAINSLVSTRETPGSARTSSTRTLSCCESSYSHSFDSHSRPYSGYC